MTRHTQRKCNRNRLFLGSSRKTAVQHLIKCWKYKQKVWRLLLLVDVRFSSFTLQRTQFRVLFTVVWLKVASNWCRVLFSLCLQESSNWLLVETAWPRQTWLNASLSTGKALSSDGKKCNLNVQISKHSAKISVYQANMRCRPLRHSNRICSSFAHSCTASEKPS